jgi:UDP-N-acetylmuramoyl-tripeptide--D-alanyl-D-alanine ligase
MTPVRISDLIAATGGRGMGIRDTSIGIARIETDSRKVRPRDLFWALKGKKHDGHDYIPQARDRGAGICVSERQSDGIPVLLVDDTLLALRDFAKWYRRQLDALIIGVTGSVGKTTTRNMVASVLAQRFHGMQSPHNYNNHIGVPLSLLQIQQDHEYAVLELAASRIGEISELADTAQPEIGLVTAIGPAHLEEFGSLENISRAKGELLAALPETGFAVLNGDDEAVRSLANRAACEVFFVGERVRNHVVARGVEEFNDRIQFQIDRSRFQVRTAGRHHLTAAIMAVTVGREVGMSDDEVAAGLESFRPVAGRCCVSRLGDWTVIDDTYNSNPRSMQAACRLLRNWAGPGNRVLVTGDMLALGAETETHHTELGRLIAGSGIDRLVALGAQAATVARSAREAGMDAGCLGACRDLDTLMLLLDCWLEPDDVVLVKGSRGMYMEQVIDRLRNQSRSAKRNSRKKKVA